MTIYGINLTIVSDSLTLSSAASYETNWMQTQDLF